MTRHILTMLLIVVGSAVGSAVFAQDGTIPTQFVTLEPRTVTGEVGGPGDNYVNATFSFRHGMNGKDALGITRNNWDLKYSETKRTDGTIVAFRFDVTMVVDDRSKIIDLGKLEWKDTFVVPELPAYEKPTRHPSVDAIEGHMYLVHSADGESDHYALFRVESIEPGKFAEISWRLIPAPEKANGEIGK